MAAAAAGSPRPPCARPSWRPARTSWRRAVPDTIRAVLEGRLDAAADPLLSPALEAALSNCLSCKACTVECPSNVNMALLKAELLYARIRKHGVPLSARLVSRVDMLGELASLAPGLANATLKWRWLRALLKRFAGFSMERPLPPYARERFDAWFHKRRGPSVLGERGTVYLWDDCFVRFNEPNIGQAAVRVLEAAGYTVNVLTGRACCVGPPSARRLDVAARFGEKNIAVAGDAGRRSSSWSRRATPCSPGLPGAGVGRRRKTRAAKRPLRDLHREPAQERSRRASFCRGRGQDRRARPLPRQGPDRKGPTGLGGARRAGQFRYHARPRLLPHGGRFWQYGVEVRTLAGGGQTADRESESPGRGHAAGRFRNELPPPDRTPGRAHAAAYGEVSDQFLP